MDIGNKLFALVVKGFEKEWLFAVSAIHSNPGISYARGSGMADNIKGQLRFAFELYVAWNTSRLAAFAVGCPLLGKVKTTVDNRCLHPTNQRGINAGLDLLPDPEVLRGILRRVRGDCVLVVEIFRLNEFERSLALLKSWLLRWGMNHD